MNKTSTTKTAASPPARTPARLAARQSSSQGTGPLLPPGNSLALFVWIWMESQGLTMPRHHRTIARWLEQRWTDGPREALLMAFRNSGKSTLVGLFCAWVLLEAPDTRILVMAADHALARKMVRNVKRIIERHPLTRRLVPARKDHWASDQFTVSRPGELRDPSMLARGIGANITGSRAELVICDDVEVPRTCNTPGRRAELRTRLHELDYVLVPGGMQLYIGTPHTFHTLYARPAASSSAGEEGEGEAFLRGFSRLEIPVLTRRGEPAWPERFPLPVIEAIRQRTGPNKFASQMMLQPVNIAEGRLNPDRLLSYDDEIDYQEGNGEPLITLGGVRMVSAACCWDPAYGGHSRGDGSVIAVVFCDAAGGYWLHRIQWLTAAPRPAAGSRPRDRPPPHPEPDDDSKYSRNENYSDEIPYSDEASWQCRQVADFLHYWHLPSVRIETNGLGRFLPGLLRRELAHRGLNISVIEQTASRNKQQRIIEAFDAPLAAGALHAHRSIWMTPFINEMREWQPLPAARDDGLDAVAACLLAEPVRLARPQTPLAPRRDWRPAGGVFHASSDFGV